MNFFKKLLGGIPPTQQMPLVQFGRYSDSYKTASQYQAWDTALKNFENENYLASFEAFFKYLCDAQEDNVRWHIERGTIYFELFQGSKKITGWADIRKLKAEARIAHVRRSKTTFMRRLAEANFDLKYGRYALDDNDDIVILFDTYTLDSSPYKLYYALKEIATHADKQDDILLDEFEALEPIQAAHIQDLSPDEKVVKYQFIKMRITSVLENLESNTGFYNQYPGAAAYLMLDLCYRLDYLISPEGFMMETLERMHRRYFEKDGQSVPQKNAAMQREIEYLAQRSQAAYFKEMYRVKATFSITTPVNHDRVMSFIDGELHNMDWYEENGHEAVAMAIPGYIIGYCLFNYAVPEPDKEFFHLYFQIMEPEYFRKLGFRPLYREAAKGIFLKKTIKKAISNIQQRHNTKYPELRAKAGTLNFSSDTAFARSYLLMVRNLNLARI